MFVFDAKALAKLQTKLEKEFPRAAKKEGRKLVKKAATELRKNIKEAAPVDTGELRRSLYVKVLRDKFGEPTAADVRVKSGGFFWRFLEYGTVKMEEQPFVEPTVERFRPKMKAYFDEYREALAKEFNE